MSAPKTARRDLPTFRTDDKPDEWIPKRYGSAVPGEQSLGERRASGKCCARIWPRDGWVDHWCGKRAQPGSHYCGIHGDAAIERREQKRAADRALRRAQREHQESRSADRQFKIDAFDALYQALAQIAAGHNDPRALASDTIKAIDQQRARNADR